MKVAVIGGTGMVGTEVVGNLTAASHEVLILSRKKPGTLPSGTSHRRIDLKTGDGLDQALTGIETVIDVANERKAATEVLVDGTRDLLDRCRTAGIGHYIGISIIGCEKVPIGYYRAKAAQEDVISGGPVNWSMLKASQFHELIDSFFTGAARFRITPTGSIPIQSISASVAGAHLASMVLAGPTGRVEHLAGPRVETLSSMAASWRDASSRRTLPLKLPVPGKLGKTLRSGALTDRSAVTPGPTFEEWLKDR